MVNRVLRFTWDEWKWLAVIVMLGVTMYWTAIVVEPTNTILTEVRKTQDQIVERGKMAVEQNSMLIENQDNNTKRLELLLTVADTLEKEHENTTNAIAKAEALSLAVLTQGNTTLKNIAQLTNDIYTLQKTELEARKTLGKFLLVQAELANMTLPDDLKKRLFIEDVEPYNSSPQ